MSALWEDPPSHFTVEDTLAKELNNLSFKDRTAIEEEIKGVRCLAVDETPELLRRTLREFDSELIGRKEGDPENHLLRNVISISSISSAEAEAAKAACYLNDQDVRLRFLRCECFAVTKAVQRFINFLEFTSELFGDFVAERPIRLSDFKTKEEKAALRNSRTQYLPFRDRSGRRVCAVVGTCGLHLDVALHCKILMYLHWVVSEDIETQRKGVVAVSWISNEKDNDTTWEKSIRPGMKAKVGTYLKKMRHAKTVRSTSHHTCFKDTPFFRALSVLYFYGMDSYHRSVYKGHFGTLLCFLNLLR